MTKFYDLHLADLKNKTEYLFEMSDEKRRNRALHYYHEEDRLRCLGAGYLMKRYLPDYSEEKLCCGNDGKPYLKDGVPFSISHGGDHIVMAYDEGAKAVGVDVEPGKDMSFYEPILSSYTTEKERILIGDDAHKAVWVWTRKESLYKCLGEGFSDFLELPDTTENIVSFSGKTILLKSFEQDGHIFSLALEVMAKSMEITLEYLPVSL